jgi:hypothetical protein
MTAAFRHLSRVKSNANSILTVNRSLFCVTSQNSSPTSLTVSLSGSRQFGHGIRVKKSSDGSRSIVVDEVDKNGTANSSDCIAKGLVEHMETSKILSIIKHQVKCVNVGRNYMDFLASGKHLHENQLDCFQAVYELWTGSEFASIIEVKPLFMFYLKTSGIESLCLNHFIQ